tara:strand:- start:1043 stop:4954 length:3912 start_codon:yes stop_codon:yes gene_type:complete
LFFANILLVSNYSQSVISEREFLIFTKNYEKQNNTNVNTKILFSKFWLRKVLGKVYLPSLIRSTALDYNKYSSNYNELLFIRHLTNTLKIESISSNDLTKHINNYDTNENVILNRKWLNESYFFKRSDNNEILKVTGVDHFNKLLNNWESFRYIHSLAEYQQTKYNRKALVEKKVFNNIYKTHKSLFPKIPEIESFISDEDITENTSDYEILVYSNVSTKITNLSGRINAIIWQQLIEDTSFNDDKERMLSLLAFAEIDEYRSDIITHLSIEAKIRFKETALQLILGETDLDNVEEEFYKVFFEDRISSRSYWNSDIQYEYDILKPTSGSYEFYEQMNKVSDNHNGNLFYAQSSRVEISYLVDQLLMLDVEYSQVTAQNPFTHNHYPITKRLLNEGLKKPYLFWEITFYLKRNKINRLPFLLIEESLSSLAFRLLDNTEIEVLPDETLSQIKTKLLKLAIELILDELSTTSLDRKDKLATILFQVFREINREKFQIIKNTRTIEIYEQEVLDKVNRENYLLNTVQDYILEVNQFPKKASKILIADYLPELLDRVDLHSPFRELSNGSWQLPLLELDYLCWLSKVSIDCILKKEKIDEDVELDIAEKFLKIYITAIEKISIKKQDWSSLKSIDVIPSWYMFNESLDQVKWIYSLILLKRKKRLLNFLEPLIQFDPIKDSYEEFNRYSARRLRSHLFVLLSTLEHINTSNGNFLRLKKETQNLKKSLESRILMILQENSNQYKVNQIDILDAQYERGFGNSGKEELIPQIAKSINWFNDKSVILNVLAKSSDLLRLLIIMEWITVEGLKKELLELIKKSKIKKFLKSKNWYPELELTITKLSEHPKLVKQVKKALDYWKTNVTKSGKKDLEKVTYLVELLMAYNKKDEAALGILITPEHNSYRVQIEFDLNSYKQFFRGLIRFNTNPESACQIFDNLHHQFPKHSSITLNRFASKINLASKNKDANLFEEALSEWEQMEPALSELSLDTIKDSIWVNKLTAYYHLDDKLKFDQLYLSIPYPYQMKEDMIALKIEILLKNQLREEAKKVLFQATEYHRGSLGKLPKFIRSLKTKLDDEIDIKYLQNNYNEIFAKHPKTLIQIFPERLNAENKIARFLAREVALANSKMLEQINSIRDVHLEDKYNDIVQLTLNARISQWGWQVKDQSRGGFSGSIGSVNAGERDLIITDSNDDILIVCEAFIWNDLPTAERHINKTFNYTHKRKDYIILIYDERIYKNFNKNWNVYKKNVLPKISYTSGFELKSNKWKELTKAFGYKATGVKAGISYHGKNTKIYHIMVNLNYKVK